MTSPGQSDNDTYTINNNDILRDSVYSIYSKLAEGADHCDLNKEFNKGILPGIFDANRDYDEIARQLGYTEEQISIGKQGSDNRGSNIGVGCGCPVSFADIEEGETVLDLGSGAGFDCFVAAEEVGISGKVIGVDMTSAMVTKARANAKHRLDLYKKPDNVSFRLGEIEHLPCADASVNVIISNCVLNLSLNKAQVLKEAFRVLIPGGRIAITDVLSIAQLPLKLQNETAFAC